MAVDPRDVTSPRSHLRGPPQVLYNQGPGPGSWSAALLNWDGKEEIGIRWNGDSDDDIGTPQSRGRPTWFVLPREVGAKVREFLADLAEESEGLLAGYQAMADDAEREAEANEWSEALIDDATP